MRIIGTITIIFGFILYAIVVSFFELDKEIEDIFYWFPNMIGLSLLFYGVGIEEKNIKKKQLIFYPAGDFFLALWAMFLFDKKIDSLVEMNKIILITITTVILCLLLYLCRRLMPILQRLLKLD